MLLLVLARHLRFDDLALDGVLGVVDVEVADELLSDRRGSLLDLACLGVLHRGADDRAEVDAAVVVKVLVLDRDRRLLEALRDLLHLDRRAQDVGLHVPEGLTVGVVDLRVGAVARRPELVDRWRGVGDVKRPDRHTGDGHRDDRQHPRDDQQDLLADRSLGASAPISCAG